MIGRTGVLLKSKAEAKSSLYMNSRTISWKMSREIIPGPLRRRDDSTNGVLYDHEKF